MLLCEHSFLSYGKKRAQIDQEKNHQNFHYINEITKNNDNDNVTTLLKPTAALRKGRDGNDDHKMDVR